MATSVAIQSRYCGGHFNAGEAQPSKASHCPPPLGHIPQAAPHQGGQSQVMMGARQPVPLGAFPHRSGAPAPEANPLATPAPPRSCRSLHQGPTEKRGIGRPGASGGASSRSAGTPPPGPGASTGSSAIPGPAPCASSNPPRPRTRPAHGHRRLDGRLRGPVPPSREPR